MPSRLMMKQQRGGAKARGKMKQQRRAGKARCRATRLTTATLGVHTIDTLKRALFNVLRTYHT